MYASMVYTTPSDVGLRTNTNIPVPVSLSPSLAAPLLDNWKFYLTEIFSEPRINIFKWTGIMIRGSLRSCLVLYIFSFIFSDVAYCLENNRFDSKVLNVGVELRKEMLPLKMGSRVYQLEGLKPNMWYEVKISYPASIPSSFSLLLTRGNPSVGQMHRRKLLNTEKIAFKTDNLELSSNQGFYVLVTVEPAGVVALPHVQERKDVIFNVVCDELLLGIPRYTWWVVILVVLCLGLALVVPYFLPSYLLRVNESSNSAMQIDLKDS